MQSDYDLGRTLAELIRQQGDGSIETGVVTRQILAQLQDLLGSDISLVNPLRDLLMRPAFCHLFSHRQGSLILGSKEALLQDLGQIYSHVVVARLSSILNGCLALPDRSWEPPSRAATSHFSSNFYPDPESIPTRHPKTNQPPPSPVSVELASDYRKSQGLVSVLIALLALLVGGLVVGVAGYMLFARPLLTSSSKSVAEPQRPTTDKQTPSTPTSPAPQERTETAQQTNSETTEPSQRPTEEVSPDTPSPTWQACLDDQSRTAPSPQPGETWWPVVGAVESLQAARQHCRADAFVNRKGVVQIASFRDRATAETFAQQLTSDNSHPFTFNVGEPTTR